MRRTVLTTGALLLLMISFSSAEAAETKQESRQIPDLSFEPNAIAAPFKAGRAALEYVLGNAETTSAILLMIGANTAYRLGRLEDAAFLLCAARIRNKYDQQKYEPRDTGGDSPQLFMSFLFHNIGESVNREVFLRPKEYAAVIKRLEAWTIKDPPGYDPGWPYTLRKIAPDLSTKLKAEYLDFYKPIALLLDTPEYFRAFKAIREYNELPVAKRSDTAALKRRSAALETMRRIEKEKNLKGFSPM